MHMNKNCDQHVRKIRKFYIGIKQRGPAVWLSKDNNKAAGDLLTSLTYGFVERR